MLCSSCRKHDKKVCCLGLTSLLPLPADQVPAEDLDRLFKATLDLLVTYKDQVAAAAKEEEPEDNDNLDDLQTDYENDEDIGSDKEMGFDGEEGDEADSIRFQNLAAQEKTFGSNDEDYDDDFSDDDDYDDDFSDDEELQSPIDEIDPFVFFVDTVKVLQASDPLRFENLTQTLDIRSECIAKYIARHAERRRIEIEEEKMEKESSAAVAVL